ncbi:hypothetical protein, partial [Sphingomonas bacterium]|uniref:hypothetical protein n=1 Tax=Sphingomonas bacterium TaxID=1895847 RepID=UPI00262B8E85
RVGVRAGAAAIGRRPNRLNQRRDSPLGGDEIGQQTRPFRALIGDETPFVVKGSIHRAVRVFMSDLST